jgi:tetratricopeptide (TPR) repeat protein
MHLAYVKAVTVSLVALAGFVFGQVEPRVPTNFTLQINGQVRYAATHQPADNVLVRVESFSGGIVSQGTTDRTGKFSFAGLVGQQYVVTVHTPGYVDVHERVDLLTSNSGYLLIDLIEDKNALGSNSGRNPELKGIVAAPDPNVPEAAYADFERGRKLLYSGDQDSAKNAIKELEKAVAIYPKYLEAHILLGLAYMDLQDWSKAENTLKAATALDQRASTAYFALGEVYLREKKYSDAQSAVTDGLKLNPDNAQAHFTLAKLLWETAPSSSDETHFRQNAEGAWKEVARALTLDPKLGEAHLLAGNMLLRAGRNVDALTHFEQYLKLEPKGRYAADTTAVVKKLREKIPKSGKGT